MRCERWGTNPGARRAGRGVAGRLLPGLAVGGGRRVRRRRGRAAVAGRGQPGAGSGPEPAGRGGGAGGAARAGPALAADAVVGEGDPAGAVTAFFDRFPGQPVVVMPKLDGLSLALV